ncbi:response regulator [Vibrio metschnikovii]|nr:response regulator [Vibrio metschnikovii]EKO3673899.1 response regulator [Vibrio metschnikovii]
METIDIVIVEDDVNITNIYLDIIQGFSRFTVVGIAESQKIARTIIQAYQPQLILLDNYLPDGLGIDLYRDILAQKKKRKQDVVLITASDDVNTVQEAMQLGCFDYLLKPISFDRFQQTLQRYLDLNNAMKAYDNLNQKYIDELFNIQHRKQQVSLLPKGIEQITLDKIISLLSLNSGDKFTVEKVSLHTGVSKTTARRYLEYCATHGLIISENEYGKVGRPERVYTKN